MKKLFAIISLLCAGLSAFSQSGFIGGSLAPSSGGSCGVLFCENFESWTNFSRNGSAPYWTQVNDGWVATWTTSSSPGSSIYPTNNASTLGMEGTSTLAINDPGGDFPTMCIQLPSDQTECWVYMEWTMHNNAYATEPHFGQLQLLDTSSNNAAKMFMLQTGSSQLTITNGFSSVVGNAISSNPSTDTSYSIWFHYAAGSGANGVTSCAFAPVGSARPTSGSQYAQITTGTATGSVRYLRLTGRQDNFDKIRVSSGGTPPADNPS